MKNISFEGCKVYKTKLRIFGKLGGRWFLFRKITTTYLIQKGGKLIPIDAKFTNYDRKDRKAS